MKVTLELRFRVRRTFAGDQERNEGRTSQAAGKIHKTSRLISRSLFLSPSFLPGNTIF